VEQRATFVPVPGSKAEGDADHDPRVLCMLQRAFAGWSADVRPMLQLTRSIPADHETSDRIAHEELLAISRVNDVSGKPLRPIVVVVDDVLNSGKHFKVAQTLISAQAPAAEIRGLFVARCVRGAASAPGDVPIPDDR
jgi:hypoxanthine-guanine phosphoribosyltransferase